MRLNGDLRVAYRASGEGERDIVLVPAWFSNCEYLPGQPIIQGWLQAITSLGRLVIFDQPGTGASDPVTSDARPTLEQWADSITAVLDDLGSREAVLLAGTGRCATAALFAATLSIPHYPRWSCWRRCANPMAERTDGPTPEAGLSPTAVAYGARASSSMRSNPDMPWNEEIRARDGHG